MKNETLKVMILALIIGFIIVGLISVVGDMLVNAI
jgi:hypothetical protein